MKEKASYYFDGEQLIIHSLNKINQPRCITNIPSFTPCIHTNYGTSGNVVVFDCLWDLACCAFPIIYEIYVRPRYFFKSIYLNLPTDKFTKIVFKGAIINLLYSPATHQQRDPKCNFSFTVNIVILK